MTLGDPMEACMTAQELLYRYLDAEGVSDKPRCTEGNRGRMRRVVTERWRSHG